MNDMKQPTDSSHSAAPITLTETEINQIADAVVAAKPWRGFFRTPEMLIAKLYAATAFTLIGLHVCFAGFVDFPNDVWRYATLAVFFGADLYFLFFPNRFDRMTVREWALAFLRREPLNRSRGYQIYYYAAGLYAVIASYLLYAHPENIQISYIFTIAYALILLINHKISHTFHWFGNKEDYRVLQLWLHQISIEPFSTISIIFYLFFLLGIWKLFFQKVSFEIPSNLASDLNFENFYLFSFYITGKVIIITGVFFSYIAVWRGTKVMRVFYETKRYITKI